MAHSLIQRLSVGEVMLLREALKIAASRKRAQARWVAKTKFVPTSAERDHEVKAERMENLREKLLPAQTFEVA